MKKGLGILSFAIVLSLSGCSQQEQAPAAAFQPPVEEIDWGMMPEEVMERLALSEECILNDDGKVVVLQCDDMSVFGQSADVQMTFDVSYQIGLLSMAVRFDDASAESLVETLNRIYGDYTAVDSEGNPCRWESEKVEDLPEEVQERFRYMKVEATAWNDEQGGFSKEAVWNTYKSESLVAANLSGNILYYQAGNMAAYQLCVDDSAYEELKNYLDANAYKGE